MKKKNIKHKKLKRFYSRSNVVKKHQPEILLGWGFIKEIKDIKQSSKDVSLVLNKRSFGSLSEMGSPKLFKAMKLSMGLMVPGMVSAQYGDWGDGDGNGDCGDACGDVDGGYW